MKTQILIGLCMAIIFSLISSASAMMIGISVEELTSEAEVVTRGKVEDSYSYWSDDGSTILTKAYIRVDAVIRQKKSDNIIEQTRIAVAYEGGEVGNIGFRKSNVASMEVGEDVLVFLKQTENDKRGFSVTGSAKTGESERVYKIVGDAQGKYTITKAGMAVKKDFSIAARKDVVVNELPVDELIEMIRRVK